MLQEPSIADTISILRGLKEKYENHHGVRILDSALIQAAQLSSRYITTRFLPDKAIDLVDEVTKKISRNLEMIGSKKCSYFSIQIIDISDTYLHFFLRSRRNCKENF